MLPIIEFKSHPNSYFAPKCQFWLDDQRIWSAKTTHDTEVGRRVQYRCNQVLYRGQQCAAAMHLVYNSDSTKVNLYLSDDEDNHDQINSELKYNHLSLIFPV